MDPLTGAVAEDDAVGVDGDGGGAEPLGQHFAQALVALGSAVEQQLRPALLQRAVQRLPEGLRRVEGGVGNEGVHGNRIRRGPEAGARPFEVAELLGERRELGPVRLCRDTRGSGGGADEGPAPDGGFDEPGRGERLVGEGHGVAVDLQLARETANRGQSRAALEAAALDLAQDGLGNLPVDRPPVPRRITLEHDLHECAVYGGVKGQSMTKNWDNIALFLTKLPVH